MDDFWHGLKDCTYCGATGMVGNKVCPKCRGTRKVPLGENIPDRYY